jgi:hypothetical protein
MLPIFYRASPLRADKELLLGDWRQLSIWLSQGKVGLYSSVALIPRGVSPHDQSPEDCPSLRMLMVVLRREWIIFIAGDLFATVLATVDS